MKKDFFISRSGRDKVITVAIAGIVKRAGFTTWIQDEDFGHTDFMGSMAQGYSSGARMIALLSSSYQQSQHCKAEYEHILVDDPRNLKERLIVLRIEVVEPIEHLRGKIYTDLVPVLNNAPELDRVVRIAIGADSERLNFHPLLPATTIIHSAVSAVAGFTGRADELESIDNALFNLNESTPSSAVSADTELALTTLHGLGGVGKSALAKQYAWLHRDRFTGIWWLRADAATRAKRSLLS